MIGKKPFNILEEIAKEEKQVQIEQRERYESEIKKFSSLLETILGKDLYSALVTQIVPPTERDLTYATFIYKGLLHRIFLHPSNFPVEYKVSLDVKDRGQWDEIIDDDLQDNFRRSLLLYLGKLERERSLPDE